MAGHWYKAETGESLHKIVGKNGKERNTTLADARKLKLVPSVSGIIGILDKPFLVRWLGQKLLDATMGRPYNGWTTDEYKKWCDETRWFAGEETRQAQDIGKAVHANLESLFKNEAIEYNEYSNIAVKAHGDIVEYLAKDAGEHDADYVAEKSFAYNGYGGTCDLSSADIILDFKTKNKDGEAFDKVTADWSHAMQVAAYKEGLVALGVVKPTAVCYNVFISTKQEGLYKWRRWKEDEITKAYKMFDCLKTFWELSNGVSHV